MSVMVHQLLRLICALTLGLASMAFLEWHPVSSHLHLAVRCFITLGVLISIDRLFFGWGLAAVCPDCGHRALSESAGSISAYQCEGECPESR